MAMTADDSYCANILAICATRNGAYAPVYWWSACKVLSTVLKFGKIENTMLHVQIQRPTLPNPRVVQHKVRGGGVTSIDSIFTTVTTVSQYMY